MIWSHSEVDRSRLRNRYPFTRLFQSYVGLVQEVAFLPYRFGSPVLESASASLGDLRETFSHIKEYDIHRKRESPFAGTGADLDPEGAWVRAVAEAAERYSMLVYDEKEFMVASGSELGSAALDLSSIPRCSETEYADPKCMLRPASTTDRIRWVRGHSLISGKETFVPAVMTYLYLKPWQTERFWVPISTGVAAHTSLHAALVSAICESIERDAIALTWLARRQLPRIADPHATAGLPFRYFSRLHRACVEHYSFDATTDLGVPVVLSAQVSKAHPSCEILVSCASALDAHTAYAKSLRETAPVRSAFSAERPIPEDMRDFCELVHGAGYYARGGHLEDFDFLLKGTDCTSLDKMANPGSASPSDKESLAMLVGKLREMGMEAVAVDITSDEVREAGLWVVRVVIPQLVPISCVYRVRYLGTPRLLKYFNHDWQAAEGPRPINPCPLPFA